MASSYSFHPEAVVEYTEAADYLLQEASPRIASEFVSRIEFAVTALVAAPERWRVVEEPDIRRYILRRFPYVIYYRWEPKSNRVVIYAVMHCSREPGYWRDRLGPDTEVK